MVGLDRLIVFPLVSQSTTSGICGATHASLPPLAIGWNFLKLFVSQCFLKKRELLAVATP
jgi:hypothetical protein